jgi:hypothetical protein
MRLATTSRGHDRGPSRDLLCLCPCLCLCSNLRYGPLQT